MERKHVNEVREIIYRLRKGEGVREVARSLNLSRNTIRKYRDRAEEANSLDPTRLLPECKELARLLGPPPVPRQMRSTVDSYEEVVKTLVEAGVEGTTIWRRLRDEHGYEGSYSSVWRYLSRKYPTEPEAFVRIETGPVDFL